MQKFQEKLAELAKNIVIVAIALVAFVLVAGIIFFMPLIKLFFHIVVLAVVFVIGTAIVIKYMRK